MKDTCGMCNHMENNKCILSGFLGCSDSDLATVEHNTEACEAFSEKEE